MKTKAGFTLLEVLIAMVVLAVGLLGLAAVQATSLKNNQSAYFRSQATQLAYDITDRMRANKLGVAALDYNNKAQTNNDCNANACTPAQMAGYDLARWNTELAAQLPSGEGVVCLDSTPTLGNSKIAHGCTNPVNTKTYAVKIWWDDNRKGTLNQKFTMSFQP